MTLKLAKELALPIATVTQKLAWLGVTGSGKTYGASKLAELLWHAGAQFIVIDPVGVWYGLRLAKDGKKPSAINIPIFGGLHGDVPLESTGGELLANLVVDKTLSCILDVSQFESDADKARFAKAFADRFFFRKKSQPSAVHLFIEECQEFVPQNPQRGEEQMLHAFIRMQKLGRNFGIGSSYISQRPQEVNKKALNMAQTLFVFRTTGTHERTAIEKWIEDKSLDESIADDLPKIHTGHCHIWSPEFLRISEMAHILEKETFNASATPEVGAVAKARELAPIDLDKVRTEMAATIEKAKADDPRELRKRIKQLEDQVVGKALTSVAVHLQKQKPALTDADRELLKTLGEEFRSFTESIAEKADVMLNSIAERAKAEIDKTAGAWFDNIEKRRALFIERLQKTRVQAVLEKLSHIQPPTTNAALQSPQTRRVDRALPPSTRSTPARLVSEGSVGPLPPGEHATLTAALQYPDGLDRKRLGILTGYKRSSRDAYIDRLRKKGLITVSGALLFPTEAGRSELNGSFEPLPTGAELIEYWRAKLPDGERATLEVLLSAGGKDVDRDRIDEATGYKRSSRDAYLTRLKARGLVEFVGPGRVRASEELFS